MTKKLFLILLIVSQMATGIDFFNKDLQDTLSIRGHVSFGDLNGDGLKDVFVSEIHHRDCFGLIPPDNCDLKGPAMVLITDEKEGFSELIQENEINETTIPAIGVGFGHEIISYKSTIADMDNDGVNDVVTSDGRILINSGNAQFLPAIYPEMGISSSAVFAIDFDNDGVLEIVNDNKISKRTSLSPLSYARNESFNVDSEHTLAFADLNNDTYTDIVSFGTSAAIRIFINDKQGNFNAAASFDLNFNERLNLLMADINGDSLIDIVLSGDKALINQGNLQFVDALGAINIENALEYFNTPNDSYIPIKLIRYNADEFPDLVIRMSDTIYYVLLNDGIGNFSISTDYFSSVVSTTIPIIVDFNNDGFEDFIQAEGDSYLDYHLMLELGGMDFEGNILSRPFESIFVDPLVFSSLSVYINNPGMGGLIPTYGSKIAFSSYLSFDIENDGTNEYISANSSIPGSSDCHEIGFILSRDFCTESPPYYLSDLSLNGFSADKLDFFENENNRYLSTLKGDINADGLDDLIVSFLECDEGCNDEKTKVFYNSESGLRADNYQEFDVLVDGVVADINADGVKETININKDFYNTGSSLQITELNTNGNASIYNFDLGSIQGKFSVHDLNNDGKSDIIYLNSAYKLVVLFGQETLDTLADGVVIVSKRAESYRFYDFDNDGDLDLYTLEDNLMIRYQNNGEGQFFDEKGLTLDSQVNNVSEFYLHDLNNDGTAEIILDFRGINLTVFEWDGSVYKSIYTLRLEYFNLLYGKSYSVNFDDFDKDGKIDIFYSDQILLSRDFSFLTGLNYDPDHNGHGFAIENVAYNQFFTVFYSYDRDGNPEWYSDLGIFKKRSDDYWSIRSSSDGNIRSEYDYSNQQAVANTSASYTGELSHDKCAEDYGKISLNYQIGITSFSSVVESGEWCSQPIVSYENRPVLNNLSGLWWAGSEDSGWGWSVELIDTPTGVNMAVVLYYYDGQGNPRWLIGQQSDFIVGQEITLNMNSISGYARFSIGTDLESTPAGTISMTLNQASNNILSAGRISVDLTYPGPEGGHWQRDNIPIALFSKPR